MGRNFSETERAEAVKLIEQNGWSDEVAADHFGVTSRSIRNWRKKYGKAFFKTMFSDVELEVLMKELGISWKQLYAKAAERRKPGGNSLFADKHRFSKFCNGTGLDRPVDLFVDELGACIKSLHPAWGGDASAFSGQVEWEVYQPSCGASGCRLGGLCIECEKKKESIDSLMKAAFPPEERDDMDGMVKILAANSGPSSHIHSVLIIGWLGKRAISLTMIEKPRRGRIAFVGYEAIHPHYNFGYLSDTLRVVRKTYEAHLKTIKSKAVEAYLAEVEPIDGELLDHYCNTHPECDRQFKCPVCEADPFIARVGKRNVSIKEEVRRLKRLLLFIKINGLPMDFVGDLAEGELFVWRQPCLPTSGGEIGNEGLEVDLVLGVCVVKDSSKAIDAAELIKSLVTVYTYAYAPGLLPQEQKDHAVYMKRFKSRIRKAGSPALCPTIAGDFRKSILDYVNKISKVAGLAAYSSIRI
jgi:hypothetical protein